MTAESKAKQAMAAASKTNGTMQNMKSGQVGDLLGRYKLQIAQAMPKHLTADRMIQMATLLITKNPAISKCTIPSIIGAVMQASQLGFRPIEALGQCYFVPYNRKVGNDWVKEVQFQIGYKGYLDLARRSGQLKSIHAFCVYKGDVFEYELGLEPVLKHKPKEDVEHTENNLTHVYAVAHYKDGGYNFIVLTKNQVEKLRLRNPMFKNSKTPTGAWASDYDKMAMAKAIKQLSTFMPLSDEFMTAINSDDAIIKPEDFAKDQSGTLVNYDNPFEEAQIDEETGEVIESEEPPKEESK